VSSEFDSFVSRIPRRGILASLLGSLLPVRVGRLAAADKGSNKKRGKKERTRLCASLRPCRTPSPGEVCAQVITPVRHVRTGTCCTCPNSCISEGWEPDRNCKASSPAKKKKEGGHKRRCKNKDKEKESQPEVRYFPRDGGNTVELCNGLPNRADRCGVQTDGPCWCGETGWVCVRRLVNRECPESYFM